MAKQGAAPMQHGGALLPAVEIVSYNVELKDDEGFIGDRASKGAFRDFIDSWRKPMREMGQDPFGDESTAKIAKKRLDALLSSGDAEAAGVIPERYRIFRARACGHHPPLSEAQGVEGRRAPGDRRRIYRKPHRRASHRPSFCAS